MKIETSRLRINKDLALIYGVLAGDGCISRAGRGYFISLTCNIHDDEPFIKNIIIPLFERIRKKKIKYRKREDCGKIEINFSDKEFFNLIKSMGFPVGIKKGIDIPNIFPENFYRYIISGYFSTDGSIVLTNNNGTIYPRIEIFSKSPKILEQIKDFLLSKGLNGNVYKINRKSGYNNGSIIYRMQFNGYDNLIKFKEIIGFINPKHENKFRRYINLVRRDGSGS